jgi:hypothetical protein
MVNFCNQRFKNNKSRSKTIDDRLFILLCVGVSNLRKRGATPMLVKSYDPNIDQGKCLGKVFANCGRAGQQWKKVSFCIP